MTVHNCRFATLFLAICVAVSPVAMAQQEASSEAREILEVSGFGGGLIIHLGCDDGRLTSRLCTGANSLVLGLENDQKSVELARQQAQSQDLVGSVVISHFHGGRLPLIDNVANLIVVEDAMNVNAQELMRVLAPGGVLCTHDGQAWTTTTKDWPEEIDQWTHYLHGPDNNAVARDSTVSIPFHLQWVGDPKWARHHNHLASTSAMVSASGRLFTIIDEGPVESLNRQPVWRLVARDAFNGVVLWKKQIGPWEGILRPFRSGPPELSRRLVAVGDCVYATLGYGQPVVCLNATNGNVIRTYEGTEDTVEIVCADGVLYLVKGRIDKTQYADSQQRRGASPPPRNKSLLAVQAETGDILWSKDDDDTVELLPTTLCINRGRAYFHSLDHVLCLNATSGAEVWRAKRSARTQRMGWSTPTLVAYQDVILCADCLGPASDGEQTDLEIVRWGVSSRPKRGDESLGHLIAFSAEDGERLWQCPTAQGYNAPPDVLVADGLVWTSTVPNLTSEDFTEGRDPATGKVIRSFKTAAAFTTTHHHRCYRNKATDQYILLGRTGTEFIDLDGKEPLRNCWIRGACQYGVLPCNGLLYLPPHSCACYIQSKLSGFWALAGERPERNVIDVQPRLERGPAYTAAAPSIQDSVDAWPTYRHDALRSGRASCDVPQDLRLVWEREIGQGTTSPTIASGRVFVAEPDGHAVHALDSTSGEHLWTRIVEGRVNSPPTIYQGRVFFGSADGHVYCLQASTGQIAWRFRAAPQDLRTVARGQLESVWPVTGSVLVHDGSLYCTAGRSSYLDGGMHWYRLDPISGELLQHREFYDRDPETGSQPEDLIEDVELPGALPDVLSCDGKSVFWRDKRLDLEGRPLNANVPHMYSSAGFLDDSWWHRTYWIYGTKTYGRASGWAVAGNYIPSGRIMALDESTVFGYGRRKIGSGDRSIGGPAFHLFRANLAVTPLAGRRPLKNNNVAIAAHFIPTKVKYHWSVDVPIVVRAMALTPDRLLIAGPSGRPDEPGYEPAFDDQADAMLLVCSSEDGQPQATVSLPSQPVFDAMAVADGQVYITCLDGTVRCYGGAVR